MISLAKSTRKLLISLIVLTSLNLGCSTGIATGFHTFNRPAPPKAVTDPRNAWKVENGHSYALNKQDFEALRNFIIRQDEALDLYECQVITSNGGAC